MSNLRRFANRLSALFHAGRAEDELSREIRAHLQLLEDKFVAQGMSTEDARYAARREFGGVEQAMEHQRDARSFRSLAGWPMDMKLGARMLIKSPGLTVIAVIALAVAFAGGATYLEFVDGLLRPTLAFPGGDRLVGIRSRDLAKNSVERRVLHDFRTWREELTLIEHLGASQEIHGDVTTDDGRAQSVDGVRISASAFRLVPAAPLMGRPLVAADEDVSAPPVAVIGEALWHTRFNSDPLIVGRTVTIENGRYTIVGVMPKAFGFPKNQNLWVPFRDAGQPIDRGEGPSIAIFGRLIEGASIDVAQAELAVVTARTAAANPASNQHLRPEVKPYVPSLSSAIDSRGQIIFLYAVNLVFILLLGVCAANVATLVFGRTVTREAEITVRTALGATRGRIVSQLVSEAMVLASVAAVVGLAAASIGLRFVRSAWEQGQGSAMPFWWDDRLSLETIIYTALLALVAALIVGGVPGLKATGPQMQSRLKQAGAGSTMRFGKLWTSIIVGQVSVTVLFLVSVVAMAWSIAAVFRQYEDVAFKRGDYLAASFALDTDGGREDAAATFRKRQEFLNRLVQLPSVANVTYTTRLPGGDQETTGIEFEGSVAEVRIAHVGPGFFETFNREVIAGRRITSDEIESGAAVAIVDESFVRFVLGGRSAVGQRVRQTARRANEEPGPWIEIVGVTADMSTSARKALKDAQLYRPIGAIPPGPVNLIVHARPAYRTKGLGQVAAAIREAASTAPAGIRVADTRTMDAGGSGDVIEYVFAALGVIGAVALLLSTAGIYALISFTLARRTREIGIRTALGASPFRIVTGILARAFWQIGLGVAAGVVPGVLIVGAVSAESGRHGLSDGIMVGAAVAAFVLIVAAVSCRVPLRRALRIQPTEALRVA